MPPERVFYLPNGVTAAKYDSWLARAADPTPSCAIRLPAPVPSPRSFPVTSRFLGRESLVARLERQIADLRTELHSELRSSMRYTLATMVAMTGVFSVIVGLIT